MKNAMLERAICIAVEAHRGQTDRTGSPFILHPLRLMLKMDGENERIVAVLHDVVERSEWTVAALRREGFAAEVVEAVERLTRRPDEPYDAYIERVKDSPIAVKVKIADIEDKADFTRLLQLEEADFERFKRFRRALQELRSHK